MCGVAGFINLNGHLASDKLLKRMTDAVAHRGPDDEGQWVSGPVGIGHRRLSVIDLSPAGRQPMVTPNGRYVLSYNGEVYNFNELRDELEPLGARFRSNTDSEVILYALAFWGVSALNRFNGMFSFALWDSLDRTLLLARDRYGIKPLYYAKQGSRIWFASEQKAIVADPDFRQEVNYSALLEYMTFQNIFTDQTLLRDISMLLPGHWMSIDADTGTIRKKQYWDFEFTEPEPPYDKREYEEELERLFRQAVKRQLTSDVEIGAYLSGGIDSGAITAIASQERNLLRTFTIGFDLKNASGFELGFDERERASAISAALGTEHHELEINSNDMEACMANLVWALEDPRVGQSYPNYYAARLARKFVKVVLSGTGGDELFGGYPWRYYVANSPQNFEDFIDSYYLYWQRLVSNSELKSLMAPIWGEVKGVWTRDIFRDVFRGHSGKLRRPEDFINHSLYFEAKTFLHGLLVVEDKVSMSNGLESRVPFLDNDVVDFAMGLPASMKLRDFQTASSVNENDVVTKHARIYGTGDGKVLLRGVMERFLPAAAITMKKQGFSAPDASWFRKESSSFVQSMLAGDDNQLVEVFDKGALMKILEMHFDGTQNRRLFVWAVMNLSYWFSLWSPTEH